MAISLDKSPTGWLDTQFHVAWTLFGITHNVYMYGANVSHYMQHPYKLKGIEWFDALTPTERGELFMRYVRRTCTRNLMISLKL